MFNTNGELWINATFNNIPAISWLSVLLVEETGVPDENHQAASSHWQTISHNVASSTPHHEQGSNTNVPVFLKYHYKISA